MQRVPTRCRLEIGERMGKRKPHPKPDKDKRELPAQSKCRLCGKTYSVRVPKRISKRTARQIAQQSDTCRSCYLGHGAEIASPKAKALGLPDLAGTPLQQQYGTIIRQDHVDDRLPALPDEAERTEFLGRVARHVEAKWWIENKKKLLTILASPKAAAVTKPPAGNAPVIEFDGGCTKNPGGVGTYGALLKIGGRVVDATCGRIGRGLTSNMAEYRGLIEGLKLAGKHSPSGPIVVRGDSKLVIRQMRGEWRALDAKLQPLRREAQAAASALGDIEYRHVPRRQNRDADYLTRIALKGQTDAMTAISERHTVRTDAPREDRDSQCQPPRDTLSGTDIVAAVSAGGAGALLGVGITMWQGSKELMAASSVVARGETLKIALDQAKERILAAARGRGAMPGRLLIVSREQVIQTTPIQLPGWNVEVRRPRNREEEEHVQRARTMARTTAHEEGRVRNELAQRERERSVRIARADGAPRVVVLKP